MAPEQHDDLLISIHDKLDTTMESPQDLISIVKDNCEQTESQNFLIGTLLGVQQRQSIVTLTTPRHTGKGITS